MKKGSCLVFLFITVLFYSCKNKIPNGILNQEKMQLVMWDIMRAEVLTDNFIGRDTSKNRVIENIKLQKQIFRLNGVTKEAYYNSLEYYKTKPTLFNTMLDSLAARVARDRDKIIRALPDSIKK